MSPSPGWSDKCGGSSVIVWNALEGSRRPIVPVRIDGKHLFLGLELNDEEHARRRKLGLGAAASGALLTALWELPLAVPISRANLDTQDLATLDESGCGWVDYRGDQIIRRFQPAGQVDLAVVPGTSLERLLHVAAEIPPTVRRAVLWRTRSKGSSRIRPRLLDEARDRGIGIMILSACGVLETGLPAALPILGRPAIYRWWQAEVAYRNWIRSTEPTVRAEPSELFGSTDHP